MRSLRRRNQGFSAISNPTNPEDPNSTELTAEERARMSAMPKYEAARDFLKKLYKTDRVRGKIKDHLAYRRRDHPFEDMDVAAVTRNVYLDNPVMLPLQEGIERIQDEHGWKSLGKFGGSDALRRYFKAASDPENQAPNNRDLSRHNTIGKTMAYDVKAPKEDYPDWMKAVAFPEYAKQFREAITNDRNWKDTMAAWDSGELKEIGDLPEAMANNKEALIMLAQAFPKRFDLGEFVTYEGIADGIADLMGDRAASLVNIKFADDDEESGGYVSREDYGSMSEEDREYFREEEEAGTLDGPRPSGMYPKDRQLGQPRTTDKRGRPQGKPYIMGLAGPMARTNKAIQVDPEAGMGTYVHELSHAADIGRRGLNFNEQAIRNALVYDEEKLDPWNSGYLMREDELFRYLSSPTETLARLNAIRYAANQMYGDDSFDMDYGSGRGMKLFNYLSDESNEKAPGAHGLSDLRIIMNDASIVKLLNEIY